MKLIFLWPSVPHSFIDPKSGDVMSGWACLRVYASLPGEELPPLPTVETTSSQYRTRSELRAAAGHGRPIVARQHQSSPFMGVLPDAITIPETVLKSLPQLTGIEGGCHTSADLLIIRRSAFPTKPS